MCLLKNFGLGFFGCQLRKRHIVRFIIVRVFVRLMLSGWILALFDEHWFSCSKDTEMNIINSTVQ